MPRRSYDQFCSLARTLDIVGERWTLLIVRELMLGPRRFGDLLDGLPGIGRNLLSARLRSLRDGGLVRRRRLDPPAGSQVYELTHDGRALGPALAELGRWGIERLGPARSGMAFRPAWAMFPLAYMSDREAARGVRETYEFQIDGESFQIVVDDGAVQPRAGSPRDAALVISMSAGTLLDLLSGALAPLDALGGGRVEVHGPAAALERCVAIVAGPQPASAPSPA